jgi:hypothetical protein
MSDQERVLRAGPVSALFVDGDLRQIRIEGRLAVNRVYFALRDAKWTTVRNEITNLRIAERSGGFTIDYEAACRAGEIDFLWRAEIVGAADGSITWRAHGRALKTFQKNRVGWCVLHPVEGLAGTRCEVEHSDGSFEPGWFPRQIAPHQPFFDIRAIRHEVAPGVSAEVRFSGDTFEMEDQRNWTDATYKIYSTPLAQPFPAAMRAGERLHQIVTLRIDRVVRVELTGEPLPMPEVGFCFSEALTPEVAKALRPAHVRVERAEDLERAVALGVPLESRYPATGVRRLLVLDEPAPDPAPSGYEIAVGTRGNFAELNRSRPDTTHADGVCFPVNPQVHATDDRTIVENLAALGTVVECAQAIAPGKRVAVTPVYLDAKRHRSWFGAAWAVATLKHFAEAGASSITYDFPYEIFGAIAGASSVVPCRSSDPLAVEALAVTQRGVLRVFLVNFSAEERRIDVRGQVVTLAAARLTAVEL